MSTFWSIWVTVITLGTVFGCWWLLHATRKGQTSDTETDRTTGHSYDGIEELDNPLPKWWFYLFGNQVQRIKNTFYTSTSFWRDNFERNERFRCSVVMFTYFHMGFITL